MPEELQETARLAERYARRSMMSSDARYSLLNPAVWQGVQERQRALIGLLNRHKPAELKDLRVLEIGCGSGSNLLELLRLGFDPRNLVANELLPERSEVARRNLPDAVALHEGNALELDLPTNSFDIVFQSTVFTSILDDAFQVRLAHRMWGWVRPTGGVLWYDFTFDNPHNPDVRGVPLRRVKALFPHGTIDSISVTLAPPISRLVCRLHPGLYGIVNVLSFLRTHVMCWIGKAA